MRDAPVLWHPGEAIVRPAIQVSSWNPPLTAMSQCTSPLGPQAAGQRRQVVAIEPDDVEPHVSETHGVLVSAIPYT